MWTDFLLICLKRALKSNPDLKLILMSATMATEKFQQYFDDCPLVEVSGRTFPVSEHYLDDLEVILSKKIVQPPAPVQILNFNSKNKGSKIATDLQTVVEVLRYVHKSHEPGAILCFLPTVADIRKVQETLEADQNSSLLILPCHSKLSVDDQQKVFRKPPLGQRKLVLATNIAETSVTIDDVKYVVNTGTCKSEILDDKS
uniref:Helicase C-terminal domain-containing protein n=1 Tax=Romanomermis culicivorax TaxID=13658 RepID=A0A915I7J5_ROMCU